ncbi:hypothetical protein TNIN_23321 [Trichonephila inaurata madagascariensis]|uniref:Uncharacterized protein n=1 Tax=Trichonephila inaurata madagascariensis TaxID=2747483 RepID=A0A8X6X4I8_9ARAC|nr:hypothetical protein TNIN_23321 [Trichonephila inaurata madagascariensis]
MSLFYVFVMNYLESIFRNGHLFAVFRKHFETVKDISFTGKNSSTGHFYAYVFVSSNNKERENFQNNIKVAGKEEGKEVYNLVNIFRENRRRKWENEAPLEQESSRKSNRLRMTCLRALETMEEQETRRKFNCLQMMQGSLKLLKIEKRDLNVSDCRSSRMAIWKDNAAYSYNPSIDYKSDASCILGPISILQCNEV